MKATVRHLLIPTLFSQSGATDSDRGNEEWKSVYNTHAYMYVPHKRTLTYHTVLHKGVHNVKEISDPKIHLVIVYSPSHWFKSIRLR